MRYSLFAGGKRIRPMLAMEAARSRDETTRRASIAAACALELIHTYSLIHDDLPALDNDDLPARQAHLPQGIRRSHGDPGRRRAADARLPGARHAADAMPDAQDRADRRTGHRGRHRRRHDRRAGADLEGEGKPPTAELLETIHRAKTGALLRASVRMGAIYAGADRAQYAALSCYGEHIGLAFQIVDDILDVEESSEALGKTAGKDAQQQKITFPGRLRLKHRAHGGEGMRRARTRRSNRSASARRGCTSWPT